MAHLEVEIPALVLARLTALAAARNETIERTAADSLEEYAASPEARQQIRRAREAAGSASLADLGWLDGYAGQSFDELMAYEGSETPEALLIAIEQPLLERIAREGINWTGVERMLLSLMALQREVNNGGFDQFFRNSSLRFGVAIVDDLKRIGCKKTAQMTRKAVKALRLEDEHLTPNNIRRVMNVPDPRRDSTFQECDEAFWQLTEVPVRLLEYLHKHPGGIRL